MKPKFRYLQCLVLHTQLYTMLVQFAGMDIQFRRCRQLSAVGNAGRVSEQFLRTNRKEAQMPATLGFSLIVAAIAAAQLDIPVFTAKFMLTNQVQWDSTILQPDNYTMTMGSTGTFTFAPVRDGRGRSVAQFMTKINEEETNARNGLLLTDKGGQLCVYALALASLGRVLVYDPALAREAVLQGAPQTVPVILEKR